MNQTGAFGYMDSDGFQVVDLPYAGGRFSMDVILPDQGNATSSLNVGQLPANLTSWLGGVQSQQVIVVAPRVQHGHQLRSEHAPLEPGHDRRVHPRYGELFRDHQPGSKPVIYHARRSPGHDQRERNRHHRHRGHGGDRFGSGRCFYTPGLRPLRRQSSFPVFDSRRSIGGDPVHGPGDRSAPARLGRLVAGRWSHGNRRPDVAAWQPFARLAGRGLRHARRPQRDRVRRPSAARRRAASTMSRPAKLRRHPAVRRTPARPVPRGEQAPTSCSRRWRRSFPSSIPASFSLERSLGKSPDAANSDLQAKPTSVPRAAAGAIAAVRGAGSAGGYSARPPLPRLPAARRPPSRPRRWPRKRPSPNRSTSLASIFIRPCSRRPAAVATCSSRRSASRLPGHGLRRSQRRNRHADGPSAALQWRCRRHRAGFRHAAHRFEQLDRGDQKHAVDRRRAVGSARHANPHPVHADPAGRFCQQHANARFRQQSQWRSGKRSTSGSRSKPRGTSRSSSRPTISTS